jgi:hypothetical protein
MTGGWVLINASRVRPSVSKVHQTHDPTEVGPRMGENDNDVNVILVRHVIPIIFTQRGSGTGSSTPGKMSVKRFSI